MYKEMSLDLNKLANKLDEALIKETTETLTKFLTNKRMSNNKQSMKLYTEEQVMNALKLAHSHIKPLQYVIDILTPIELPSDEEIEKISQDINGVDLVNICGILEAKAFNRGAKWMRDKIQGGNK